MKIGLFIKDFAAGKQFSKNGLPMKSGAEFQADNYARQLIRRGNQVTIFAKKRYWFTKAREIIGGIDVVRLHAPFRWLEIFVRLLTTHRDIDSFYIIWTPAFAVWAIFYARIFHKPVTMSLTISEELFAGKATWRNKILAKCSCYIANTREIRRGLADNLADDPPPRIVLLPHGIDTLAFPMVSPCKKCELRVKYSIPAKELVLLFCARVDLRKGSPTYKQWVAVELSAENKRMLMIPRGFGHGFKTLSDDVEFCYKVDNLYSKECDRGIRFDDPTIGVEWGEVKEELLSQKDMGAPMLDESDCNFTYEELK